MATERAPHTFGEHPPVNTNVRFAVGSGRARRANFNMGWRGTDSSAALVEDVFPGALIAPKPVMHV